MEVMEAVRKGTSDAILALVAGAKIRLSTADFTPDPLSSLTDFALADFDGYDDIDVVGGTQFRDNGSGEWVVLLPVVASYVAGAGIEEAQEVFCWYVTNTAGTVLLAADRLAEPFTFTLEGDGLVLPTISIRVGIGAFSRLTPIA